MFSESSGNEIEIVIFSSQHRTDVDRPHHLKFHAKQNESYIVRIEYMVQSSITENLFGCYLKQFNTYSNYLGSIGLCEQNIQITSTNTFQFDKVADVAFDSDGFLWVTEDDINYLNNRVLQINSKTQGVMHVRSAPNNQSGSGPQKNNHPHLIDTYDMNRVRIADSLNNRVQIIGTDGTFIHELNYFGLEGVYGVCIKKNPINSKRFLKLSTSRTNSQNGGSVKTFEVVDYSLPVPSNCLLEFQWDIELLKGT